MVGGAKNVRKSGCSAPRAYPHTNSANRNGTWKWQAGYNGESGRLRADQPPGHGRQQREKRDTGARRPPHTRPLHSGAAHTQGLRSLGEVQHLGALGGTVWV